MKKVLIIISVLLFTDCKNQSVMSSVNRQDSVITIKTNHNDILAPFDGRLILFDSTSVTISDQKENGTSVTYKGVNRISSKSIVKKGDIIAEALFIDSSWTYSVSIRRGPYLSMVPICELLSLKNCTEQSQSDTLGWTGVILQEMLGSEQLTNVMLQHDYTSVGEWRIDVKHRKRIKSIRQLNKKETEEIQKIIYKYGGRIGYVYCKDTSSLPNETYIDDLEYYKLYFIGFK